MDDLDDFEICKKCQIPIKGKLFKRHLNNNKSCKAVYDDQEIETIRINRAKEINKRRNKKDYEDNKEVILKRVKKNNSENIQKIKEYNQKYYEANKMKQTDMLQESRILAFKQNIIEGPNFVCTSCRRCLFKKSVR